MAVKARVEGNALVLTLPKSLNIEEGATFEPELDKAGVIKFVPTVDVSDTIEEFFEGWDGKNQPDDDLSDWDTMTSFFIKINDEVESLFEFLNEEVLGDFLMAIGQPLPYITSQKVANIAHRDGEFHKLVGATNPNKMGTDFIEIGDPIPVRLGNSREYWMRNTVVKYKDELLNEVNLGLSKNKNGNHN
jgi:hypothetical protein